MKVKNYSLALGGGSSKGMAHIGVLKYLEENQEKIKIVEISGTSIGSIIGSCLAIGMKSDEIMYFVREINFLKLIDLNFKSGLLYGNKVYQKLEILFGEIKIEETKIPLKIIATNINTGEKEIFTFGKIVDAIRASISLPIIFENFKLNGNNYLDGGLCSNLPILELEGNDIIAVSVMNEKFGKIQTHKKVFNLNFKRLFFGFNYEILKKTISIIMLNNEKLNLQIAKNMGKNIILLSPDVSKYEYYDFLKFEEIFEKGYNEAKKILK